MTDRTITLDTLSEAVGSAVAIRANLNLQPAAGAGTKVFPPTYVGDQNDAHGATRYATELRRIDNADLPCVLLDSVASQANRMEEALLEAWEDEDLGFPVVRVDFSEADSELESPVGSISSLEAPHRIYDAILRDSVDEDGVLFRYTRAGQAATHATVRNATALFHYCPTALVFGAWDSTGPKGGMGSKFPRALCSEIVAVGVQTGTRVGGRLDPLGIVKAAGPVFAQQGDEGWVNEKPGGKAKELNPSDINHGNVAPSRSAENGGVTFDYALQTTVLSLPALRRLRFRYDLDGAPMTDRRSAERAGRTALAALALAGIAGAHAQGHDLRSGTLLVPEGPLTFEVIGPAGSILRTFELDRDDAAQLVSAAAKAAAEQGLAWEREPLAPLRPAPKLVALLARSQALEAQKAPQDGEAG